MCGRFVRDLSVPDIVSEFGIDEADSDIQPSYNIAPGQEVAIIMHEGGKRLLPCRWGFMPKWAKDASAGYKMINARAETVSEKPSFRGAFKSSRILIVATGFYEWKKEGKLKTPHYIYLKSKRPFGMAGLFSMWASPEGRQICTCTIITTSANSLLEPIHNRMPVIVNKNDENIWIDRQGHDSSTLLPLLEPYSSDKMEYHSVSKLVNSASNNSSECIKAV